MAFGALLFIYFLNFLSYTGAVLGIGISAVVIAVFYLTIGVTFALTGDRISLKAQKVYRLLSVVMFAIFMFLNFVLTTTIWSGRMGATAWTIKIVSIAVSLAFAIFYVVAQCTDEPMMQRLARLLSFAFVVSLVFDLLFDVTGSGKTLGDIDVLLVVIYGVYTFYLFNSLEKIECDVHFEAEVNSTEEGNSTDEN